VTEMTIAERGTAIQRTKAMLKRTDNVHKFLTRALAQIIAAKAESTKCLPLTHKKGFVYVYLHRGIPQYAGKTSGALGTRHKQHCYRKRTDGPFANSYAQHVVGLSRKKAEDQGKKKQYEAAYARGQRLIGKMKVVYLAIENNFHRSLLEAAATIVFRTKYNKQ
jgi:hypothetical protein